MYSFLEKTLIFRWICTRKCLILKLSNQITYQSSDNKSKNFMFSTNFLVVHIFIFIFIFHFLEHFTISKYFTKKYRTNFCKNDESTSKSEQREIRELIQLCSPFFQNLKISYGSLEIVVCNFI